MAQTQQPLQSPQQQLPALGSGNAFQAMPGQGSTAAAAPSTSAAGAAGAGAAAAATGGGGSQGNATYSPIAASDALQRAGNDPRRALDDVVADRNRMAADNLKLWNLVGKIRKENDALKARLAELGEGDAGDKDAAAAAAARAQNIMQQRAAAQAQAQAISSGSGAVVGLGSSSGSSSNANGSTTVDSYGVVDEVGTGADNSHGGIHSALGLSQEAATPVKQQPGAGSQQYTPQQQQAHGTPRNVAGIGAGGAVASPRSASQQLPVSPRARNAGLPSTYDSPTSSPYSAQAQASALLQAAAGVASTNVASPGRGASGSHSRSRTQDLGQAIATAAFLSSSSTTPRLDANTLTSNTAIHVPSSRLRVMERGRETVYFEVAVTILVAPAHWGPPPAANAQGILMGDFPPMKWVVEKTLSDLAGLDARLRQKHGKSAAKKLGELPDQALFVDHAPSRVDQRKVIVETYLQKLITLPLPDKDDIITFLCTDVARPRNVDPNALAKEGFLTKKGLNPGRWVTRYYCLRTPPSAGSQGNGPTTNAGTSGSSGFDKQSYRLDYYEYNGGPQIGSINIVGAEIGRQQRNTASDMDENSYRHAFLILERRPVANANANGGELASSGTMNSLVSASAASNGPGGAGAAAAANGAATPSAMQTVRHVLCAENDRERDEWVDVLVRAIDAAHREANAMLATAVAASVPPTSSGFLQPAPMLGAGPGASNAGISHPGSPLGNHNVGLPSVGSVDPRQPSALQTNVGTYDGMPSPSGAGAASSPVTHQPLGTGSSNAVSGLPGAGGSTGGHSSGSAGRQGSAGVGGAGVSSLGHGKPPSSIGHLAQPSPRGANVNLPSDSGHGHGYSQSHGVHGQGYGVGGYQGSLPHHGYDPTAAGRLAGGVPIQGRSFSTDASAGVPGSFGSGAAPSGMAATGSVSNVSHHDSLAPSASMTSNTSYSTSSGVPPSGGTPQSRNTKPAISGPMNGAPIPQGSKFGSAVPGRNGSGSTAGGVGAGGTNGIEEEVERKEKDSEKKRFWQGFRGFGHSDKDKDKSGHGSKSSASSQQLQGPLDPAKAVFGVPLADAIAVSKVGEGLGLPSVVYRCIEYLERRNAYREEGIYRLSGSSAVIKSLKDKFNAQGDVDLLAPGVEFYDPHAVAGLLKTFLRELPESVLTRELHFEFLRVNDVPDRRDRVRELGRLVCMLPLPNYSVLRTLCSHLIKIIQHSDVNKMTMRNVGIVFSPTLAIPAGVFALFLTEFDYVFFTDAKGTRAPMTIEDEEAANLEAMAAAAAAALGRQLSPPPGQGSSGTTPGGLTAPSASNPGSSPGGGTPRKAGRNPNRASWIAGSTLHSGGDGATHELAMQMAAAQEAGSMPSPQAAQAAIQHYSSSSPATQGSGQGGVPAGQRSNRNSLSYNEADAERLLGLGTGLGAHKLGGLEISAAEEELGAMSTALMAGSGAASGEAGAGAASTPVSGGMAASSLAAAAGNGDNDGALER